MVVIELPCATDPLVGLRVSLTDGIKFAVTVPAAVGVMVVDALVVLPNVMDRVLDVHDENL